MTFGPSDLIVCPTWWDSAAIMASVAWLVIALAVLWEHRRATSSVLILQLALCPLLAGSSAAWLDLRHTMIGIRLVAQPSESAIARGLIDIHFAIQVATYCAAVLVAAAQLTKHDHRGHTFSSDLRPWTLACLGALTTSVSASVAVALWLDQSNLPPEWAIPVCLGVAFVMIALAVASALLAVRRSHEAQGRSRASEFAFLVALALLTLLLTSLRNRFLLST